MANLEFRGLKDFKTSPLLKSTVRT